MRRVALTLAGLAVAVIALFGIDGVAYAATGSSLVLGRLNTAGQTTVIQAGSDPVLDLRSASDAAVPFTVNGQGKVWNLNVDRIDSLDSRQLQRRIEDTCPSGQALAGAAAAGTPICRGIEPTSLVVRVTSTGPFDEPQEFRTGPLPAGRYVAALTADLVPAARGTAAAPKTAACYASVQGRRVAWAAGDDRGALAAVPLRTSDLIDVAAGPASIVCGFERGTWSFAADGAVRLVLMPAPTVDAVAAVPGGAAILPTR